MFSSVTSGAANGISSYLMQVEVDVSDGLPSFNMVGFMSGEVREAGDRVKVALKNAGTKVPAAKITINLSPAGIRKSAGEYSTAGQNTGRKWDHCCFRLS